MFADLKNLDIQPKTIDVQHLPELVLSETLREKLQKMFQEEEEKFVRVYGSTTIVQIKTNYVFFSSQWYYLAVLCKDFADNLIPYGKCFDDKVRGSLSLLEALYNNDTDNAELKNLFPDDEERTKFQLYVNGGDISSFRPGKALINYNNNKYTARATSDIFGSCVLKKIAVPDASSDYLGYVIYYLAKRPDLYNELNNEISQQIEAASDGKKLPSIVKDRAQFIVDYIYKVDGFKRIKDCFEISGQTIKINTNGIEEVLPDGNWLRYMFVLPTSDMYGTRTFKDEYVIKKDGVDYKCRLTTEWVGKNVEAGLQGNNYLPALVKIVNKYYADVLHIAKEAGDYYIHVSKQDFIFTELPEVFQNDFARRYITSLLAKPFVILTGGSGTGKTRICKQFAEYLEVLDENGERNWLIVPVGADWTDNTKILGFYNPLANEGKGKYEETGILKLIERANAHPDIPYFVVLDEMNLSHVERYFSDFLSHMEIPDEPFVLDGYEKNELSYPENLFVVGTVNIDETTYMFSPKVLDRANVVEFKPNKDDVLKLFDSYHEASIKVTPAKLGTAESFLSLAKEIRKGLCNVDQKDLDVVKDVFEKIYQVAEDQKQGYEFAYRTVREIRQYICAANELNKSDQAFRVFNSIDEQLLQKILPKVHGNKKEIATLLDELEKICKDKQFNLEQSAKKIEQMKGKLATVQYASFI